MRAGETDAVARLMHGLYDEGDGIRSISAEKIARTFAHLDGQPSRGLCAVADRVGEIVGYALAVPVWFSEYGGFVLWLDELYINPTHRSMGIGGDFLRWLEAYARATGFHAVSLLSLTHNVAALRFYDRNGYERLPVTVFDKLL